MQLLHEHNVLASGNTNINISLKGSSQNFDVKERKSSSASLLMNPVASGDNFTTLHNSTQKLKEDSPTLIPCCEGRELEISEDLVRTGLSAISVKHDNVSQSLSLSRACERLLVPPGLVKHRNSFRSLHRPDLKRVPYLRRMTPDELEMLFRGYSDMPGRGPVKSDESDENSRAMLPPDENIMISDKHKALGSHEDGVLNPTLARSGHEDLPAGMRLHGARARLYTSVLAGSKAGDQLDGISVTEEFDKRVHSEDPLPEDEVQLTEELQIILPPRCDDVVDSVTASYTDYGISN